MCRRMAVCIKKEETKMITKKMVGKKKKVMFRFVITLDDAQLLVYEQ